MGRLNKRDRARGVGGGRDISKFARKIYILKRDKSDGFTKNTSLYTFCLVRFAILEGLMLDVVCHPVFGCSKQLVNSSKSVTVHGSKDRIFILIGTIM